MSFAFLPLYTGDYLRDTRHLTPQKHGIYLLLLMHSWDQKGPVPLDEQEAAGISNCRSSDEIESLRYILNRYFIRMDDGWYNKRMQTEVERSENVSKARSEAGRKGYQAKAKQLLSKCKASASTPTPTPIKTKNQTPHTPQGGFDEFWSAYPKKVGKGAAEKAWAKAKVGNHLEQVLQALDVQKHSEQWRKDNGQFIPNPATWINQRRWEDELVTVDDGKPSPWAGAA